MYKLDNVWKWDCITLPLNYNLDTNIYLYGNNHISILTVKIYNGVTFYPDEKILYNILTSYNYYQPYINLLPGKLSSSYELKIDIAYKTNNQLIFLCRSTYYMTKNTFINYIYFKLQPWYTIKNKNLCKYCSKIIKISKSTVCTQCYEYANDLFIANLNIYKMIISFVELPDIINIIIYNYILLLEYNSIDAHKINRIRNPLIIDIPFINLVEI